MKTKVLLILIAIAFLLSCKRNKKEEKPVTQEAVEEVKDIAEPSKEILELLKFADTTLTKDDTLNKLLIFNSIDANDSIANLNNSEAVQLYKDKKKDRSGDKVLILNIKNTHEAILVFGAKGYEGPIWAKVLVNTETKEVVKIEFGHQFESEGYGAGITAGSFEKQFLGGSYSTKKNVYGLRQGDKKVLSGKTQVDGISGATVTSSNVVQMVNEGLQKYRNYKTIGK